MKRKKYEVGKVINNKWVIVAILEIKKQNKKVLCFNFQELNFVEGWIWDFTRDLINPNKKPKEINCHVINIRTKGMTKKEVLDEHFECSNIIYCKTKEAYKGLSKEEYMLLKDLREGITANILEVLKKFDLLLTNSGHSRRNTNLARLIACTYWLLVYRGYWKEDNTDN